MLVNISVVGDAELIERFDKLPAAAIAALSIKVTRLALELENWVKTKKLNGQVLNRITGALSRSIFNKIENLASAVYGVVYSSGDVKYAGIHEYGGQTAPHIIEPKKANVLAFAMGGKMVFAAKVNHPGSKMPERSFLRSSLRDRSVHISTEMKKAVFTAAQKAVSG